MMSEKQILYLSNNGIVIYRWHQNQLIDDLHLIEPDDSKQLLTDYFKQNGNKPISLVIDILEEVYTLESIPHLNARDRLAMISRKQKQLYPNYNFVLSQYKGRSSSERKDDLLLFTAISNDQIIQQWIHLLYEIKVKIAGIYSLPILMENFSKQLPGKQNKLIISISIDKQDISIRQSFFMNNVLALSRFKQIYLFNQEGLAKEIEEDINRSQRFISRQYSIAFEKNVSVYFFTSGSVGLHIFEQIDFQAIGLLPTLLNTNEYAQSQGDIVSADCGLPAYITGLSSKKRRQKTHYINIQSRFYYIHHLINKSLNYASMGLVLFSVIYLYYGYSNNSSLSDQVEKLSKQRLQLTEKLVNTADTPLFKGFNPHQLFKQLQLQTKLNKQIVSSKNIMDSISQSMDLFPEIVLTNFEWGAKEKDNNAAPDIGLMPPPTDPMQGELANLDINTNGPPILITIEARLQRFNGDFRYALDLIEQFRLHLNSNSSITNTKSIKLPVDISNSNELSGTMANQQNKGHFILELQWQR